MKLITLAAKIKTNVLIDLNIYTILFILRIILNDKWCFLGGQ